MKKILKRRTKPKGQDLEEKLENQKNLENGITIEKKTHLIAMVLLR
jgi:hypothetical protein